MSGLIQAHSKIGASSYSRWSKKHGGCPGSVKMCEGIPSVESVYAAEGTLAHNYAAEVLEMLTGGKKPTGITVDKFMSDALQPYIDFVVGEWRAAGDHLHARESAPIYIEQRLDLSSIYPGLFGTGDAVIYWPKIKKLQVIDLKFGAGIAVEVEDNLQLQYYGLGALLSTKFPCDTVELVIVQPRCEHPDGVIRKWSFKSVEILDFAADLAEDAAATADPEAYLNPGKHCRFCPAAAAKCPAIKEKSLAAAKVQFTDVASYDPDKLAEALKAVPIMEAWIKNVHEFAYNEAMHGRSPPGFKLVEKRATRKWSKPEDEIIDYMKKAKPQTDAAEFFERKLKSPAQMEKLISKQLGTKLREMIESVSSGYSLVPESDKRIEAKFDPASQFTTIEGEIE